MENLGLVGVTGESEIGRGSLGSGIGRGSLGNLGLLGGSWFECPGMLYKKNVFKYANIALHLTKTAGKRLNI